MATLLLAKKLTNQITKAAESAGLDLEIDLANFYNDGSRKAAGCKGTIRNAKTGKRVIVLSSESCPDLIRLDIIADPDDLYPDEIFNARPDRTAEKIISLLTPKPLTHENLSSANLTNLPSLDKNPLLAAYLSDSASNTGGWTDGRRMLRQTVQAQGFSLEDFTSYPYPTDDTAYGVATVLWNNLAQSCTERHMVCHHLLAYHDVRPSESVKGRLAYYQDDAKRAKGIRTPIKVRKYLQKFFKDFRTDEELEQIAETLDELMQSSDDWDVRLYSDADLDGWSDAYYHVGSCMNIQHKNYGVGELETFRCYCTHAMTDGAESSGLTLAVLYQDGKPVARAITYEQNGSLYYVRNYGDDRLVRWLDDNGYAQQNWLPNGTHLWTEDYLGGNGSDYLSPYVDGDSDDATAKLIHENGQPYWVISSDGVVLQNCCGYTCAYTQTCDCCDDNIADGDEYERTDMHGNDVTLCYDCMCDHCHTVNDEVDTYVSYNDEDDLVRTNDQGYYTEDYLDDNDLVRTGDHDVICLDDAEYCECRGEYYSRSDFTDYSDEPEFVKATWHGYINEYGFVLTRLLRRDGTYIDELDCYVHDAHVSAVIARLESERA